MSTEWRPDQPWRALERDEAKISIELRIRLTPKGGRDAVERLIETPEGLAVQARVRAVPENNAANQALCWLLADWLAVPKSAISLSAGSKSRIKRVVILCPTGTSATITDRINSLSRT